MLLILLAAAKKLAEKQIPKEDNAGNVNVPGGKVKPNEGQRPWRREKRRRRTGADKNSTIRPI